MINKIDRCYLELDMDTEEIYQRMLRIIENVNVIIATYDDGSMGDMMIDPLKGNCAFGSGYMCWAFSLHTFS